MPVSPFSPRTLRTHQSESESISLPGAGAHEVPGLHSRGDGHGSGVVVVVGSLLCVPFIDRDHACDARFLSTALSKPFRAQKGCLTFKSEAQTRGEAVSHFPLHHIPATTRGRLSKMKTHAGLTVKRVALRRDFHPWNHGQVFHELRCATLTARVLRISRISKTQCFTDRVGEAYPPMFQFAPSLRART